MTDLFAYEKEIYSQGYLLPGGVDEAGRGPLAGPVCAACVILDPARIPQGINDSKKLSPKKREKLFAEILEAAKTGIALTDEKEIDRLNIREATRLTMRKAVAAMSVQPDYLLIDGDFTPGAMENEHSQVKGDALSASVAAASILAKVTRDRLMVEMDALYPQYGFARHKGYGTPEHLAALRAYGPCPIHRRSFLKNISGIPGVTL